MPRKKKEQTTVKYYIPKGTKQKIDHIVDTSNFYTNKPVWKQKFYILCDYIADQNFMMELEVDKQYVNIHQETMAEILGVNNTNMAIILKDAVSSKLLKRDGLFRVALKKKGNKSADYIQEGKSYGYQFKEWNDLEEIIIIDHRRPYRKNALKEVLGKKPLPKKLSQYNEVLNYIKIDETKIDEVIPVVIENKKAKKKQEQLYRSFIQKAEAAFNEQKTALSPNRRILNDCCVEKYYREHDKDVSNSSKKINIHTHIPFDGTIVPVKIEVDEPYKYTGNDKLCAPCVFEIRYFKKRKEKPEESESTIIARCKRAVYYINEMPTLPHRKGEYGRVFTTITNLNREFRTSIRLDGKKIIGLDIANSQPLLASILIKRWYENKTVEMPADVLQYQKDCEEGQFYNNFMKELNVPDDLRSQFKQEFFNKVFFSKVIEKNNMLKEMFMDKYPSCWEAICEMKGGLYDNKQYKNFAIALQGIEAFIMFDTVNIGLIERGIKAFNIFDSIYVTSKEDYEVAEQMTREAFREFGLNPKFKMEYQEHLVE